MKQKIRDIEEGAPKKHFLTSSLIEYGYLSDDSLDIIKFNELFNELEAIYDASLIFQATRYLCNYAENPNVTIDDPYKYFKVSITSYLERVTKVRTTDNKTDIEKLFESLLTN